MDLDDAPRAVKAGRRARAAAAAADPVELDMGGAERGSRTVASRQLGEEGSLKLGGMMQELSPQQSPGPGGGDGPAAGPDSPDDSKPPPPRRGGFEGGFDGPNESRPPINMDPMADNAGKKFTGMSRRKQEQQVQQEEEKARARSKYDDRLQAAEIMDIPELEEEGKEDLSRVVAEAPKVRSNKVQGIDELNEDTQFNLPATEDHEIDLSMLTTVLCSSEQVYEPDEVWEPDMLLTQVASELNQEKELAEGPDADAGDQPPDLGMHT